MYHEITDKERLRRSIKSKVIILVVIAVIAACCAGYMLFQNNARTQGAYALRESILNMAKQACSIEGSYPSTLAYLEKNYALVVNHDDYVVSYECFAGNIMPTVVVTPR